MVLILAADFSTVGLLDKDTLKLEMIPPEEFSPALTKIRKLFPISSYLRDVPVSDLFFTPITITENNELLVVQKKAIIRLSPKSKSIERWKLKFTPTDIGFLNQDLLIAAGANGKDNQNFLVYSAMQFGSEIRGIIPFDSKYQSIEYSSEAPSISNTSPRLVQTFQSDVLGFFFPLSYFIRVLDRSIEEWSVEIYEPKMTNRERLNSISRMLPNRYSGITVPTLYSVSFFDQKILILSHSNFVILSETGGVLFRTENIPPIWNQMCICPPYLLLTCLGKSVLHIGKIQD